MRDQMTDISVVFAGMVVVMATAEKMGMTAFNPRPDLCSRESCLPVPVNAPAEA